MLHTSMDWGLSSSVKWGNLLSPCRRCEVKGEFKYFLLILQYNYNCLLSGSPSVNCTQYYYGNYRYHCRHPWPKRELRSCVEQMRSIDAEDRPSKRSDMAKLSGFAGLSILFSLYGFNVLSQLVLDAMHIIPLNVISHHLHHCFDEKIVTMDDLN